MTDLWYPGGPEPPRTWALWDAVAERLRSPTMEALLNGGPLQGKVYAIWEDESRALDLPAPWARVVILPVTGTFQIPDDVGADRVVPFLIRADVQPPKDGRYNPARLLEALQAEAWRRLRGWTPGALQHVEVHLPIWRSTAPQAIPLWNEGDGTLFLSAEYRVVAEPLTEEAYDG